MVDLAAYRGTDICSQRSECKEYSKYILFLYCTSALFHPHFQYGLEVP